jgi:hypothetical protein
MPRDGSITPRDLIGRIDVLRVECVKCDRYGRYAVDQLALRIGLDAKLVDWLAALTNDCPRKRSPGLSDPCGAVMPDLVQLFGERT